MVRADGERVIVIFLEMINVPLINVNTKIFQIKIVMFDFTTPFVSHSNPTIRGERRNSGSKGNVHLDRSIGRMEKFLGVARENLEAETSTEYRLRD